MRRNDGLVRIGALLAIAISFNIASIRFREGNFAFVSLVVLKIDTRSESFCNDSKRNRERTMGQHRRNNTVAMRFRGWPVNN